MNGWSKRRTVTMACIVLLATLMVFMLHEAMEDPVVRRTYVGVPDWPKGAPSIRIAALTDIHAGPPDMMPARLGRVVGTVNALKPDLVAITGDFLSHKLLLSVSDRERKMLEPLAALSAPLGVVATMGNHEHVYGYRKVDAILRQLGVTILSNTAVAKGPLVLIGADDPVTGHEDLRKAEAAANPLRGVRVMMTHSPTLLDWMPARVRLYLAGHTHCGQIRLPGIGPILPWHRDVPVTCGQARYKGAEIIVGAGLGTSGVPFRLGAPPDLWLVTIGPIRAR